MNHLLSLPALLALALPAFAGPAPIPATRPSPLLYMRLAAPPGARVTLHGAGGSGRVLTPSVPVGLRPGYRYRLSITDLPGRPGLTLYPTVEVLGTLYLTRHLEASSFPVPLVISEDDVEMVTGARMLARIVYLEHPDKAAPVATRPGDLREEDLPQGTDPITEAMRRGRPMLLVRLGDGIADRRELAQGPVPLGLPTQVWPKWPFHDPVYGPRGPEEECFHDGGDRGIRAGLDPDGTLRGLDPEDTVAEYTGPDGRRRVVHSNRCCICVPRYAALRCLVPLDQSITALGPAGTQATKRQEQVEHRVPSLQTRQTKVPEHVQGRERPSVNVQVKAPGDIVGVKFLQAHEITMGLAELIGRKQLALLTETQKVYLARQLKVVRDLFGTERVSAFEQLKGVSVVARVCEGPQLLVGFVAVRDLTVCCEDEQPTLPDRPLVIVKCCDKHVAQVGEIITFTLRYSNHGGRPITDIAVSDSLSGRLEYVPGSAESDRDAVFTTQANEAGSVVLRWEIGGRLQPGESGRVKFQARVR